MTAQPSKQCRNTQEGPRPGSRWIMCIINTCPPQRLSTRACVWVVCMLFNKIHDTSLRYIHPHIHIHIQHDPSGPLRSLWSLYHLPYVLCVHDGVHTSSQFYYEVPIGAASCVLRATSHTQHQHHQHRGPPAPANSACLLAAQGSPQFTLFTVHGTS